MYRLLIFIILLGSQLTGQTWKPLFSSQVDGSMLQVDNLGNILVVNGDELIKLNDRGSLFKVYSNKSLGKISHVDGSNPLKLLVFYRDLTRIIFLDNTLTENGEAIRLEEQDLELTSLAATSFGNGLWLYNNVQFELLRLNQNLQVAARTMYINQLIGSELNPEYMQEFENHLYLAEPEKGLLMFDLFGTYIKCIPLKGITKFSAWGDLIYYTNTKGMLSAFNRRTFEEGVVAFPEMEFRDWAMWKNRLYLLLNGSVAVYEFAE